MKPILLSFFNYDLRSAPVFAGLGALAAMLYLRSRRSALGLTWEDFWGLLLALMLGVFVGGVGTYVLLYGPGPTVNLERLLRGHVAGGSFLGVFGGAVAAAFLFCRQRALALSPVADALGSAAALGLVFMRVGCLLNGCCYGRPTGSSWGIVFRDGASRIPHELLGVPLHPIQLYEAGGAGIIFLWLHFVVSPRMRRGAMKPGSGFLFCMSFYAVLRFVGDFFRASDPGRLAFAGLSTAQLLVLFILALAGGIWLRRRTPI